MPRGRVVGPGRNYKELGSVHNQIPCMYVLNSQRITKYILMPSEDEIKFST